MSDDKVLVSRKQICDLMDALRIAESYVQTAFARAQQRDKLGRKLPADHPISLDLGRVLAALAQPSDGALTNEGAEPVACDFSDAYRGARDELLEWKRRALEAEAKVRKYDQRIVDLGVLGMQAAVRKPAPASVVLPPAPELPEEPPFADDDSYMDAYHAAFRMRTACAEAIAAAGVGLRLEP